MYNRLLACCRDATSWQPVVHREALSQMKILSIVEATNINAVAKNVLEFSRSARANCGKRLLTFRLSKAQ